MTTEAQLGDLLTGALARNTEDTYTFTVTAGGEVGFDLDFDQVTNQSRIVTIRLTDASGREILNERSAADRAWHTVIQQAGTYTVDVSASGSIDANLLDYAIATSFTSVPNVTYEEAAHNTASSAMSIVAGRPVVGALQTGEIDYFKVSASEAGRLHLNFAHPAGTGTDGARISVLITDSATGKQLVSQSLPGSQLLSANLDGGGTYLVRVADASFQDHGIYAFTATTSNQRGDDFVQGTAANNLFSSSAGIDTFSGNGGFDTVQYARNAADYRLGVSDAGIMVEAIAGADGRDALFNISRIKFADKTIDFGDMTNAAMLYRLYDAALNRAPDEAGLGFWLSAVDGGLPMHRVVHGFVESAEFARLYSKTLSNTDLVTEFYRNILDREPDEEGLAFWAGALDGGTNVAAVVEAFSESAEHQAMLVGQLSLGVTYIPFG